MATEDQFLFVYPNIYDPTFGSFPGNVPTALEYPMSKHLRLTTTPGGFPARTLSHYISLKSYVGADAGDVETISGYMGDNDNAATGRSNPSFNLPKNATVSSASNVFWYIQAMTPASGAPNVEVQIKMTYYVEMFGVRTPIVPGPPQADHTLMCDTPGWTVEPITPDDHLSDSVLVDRVVAQLKASKKS